MKTYYLILITSAVALFTIILVKGTGLWYDEIVVTEISKLPMPNLINIVNTEPHPLGFYLVLKPFSNLSAEWLRISLIFISTCLMLVVCHLNREIIRKYKLELSLVLIITSSFWYFIIGNLKQEIISFPLLMLAFFLFLRCYETQSDKDFFKLCLVALLIFAFGYIYFGFVLIGIIYLFINQYSKSKSTLIISLGIILAIYFVIFGKTQLENNIGRFTWQKNDYMGPLAILKSSIGGFFTNKSQLFISDLLTITSFILFIQFALKPKSRIEQITLRGFLILAVGEILLVGLARHRYAGGLVILYLTMIGWELSKFIDSLKKGTKEKFVLIVIITLLYNGVSNFYLINEVDNYYKRRVLTVKELIQDEPTGVLIRHPIESFVIKLGYLKGEQNIVPINLDNADLIYEGKITKKLVHADGRYYDSSKDKIAENIKASGLKRFVYYLEEVSSGDNAPNYFDYDQRVIQTLSEQCAENKFVLIKSYLFVVFDKC